MLYLKLELNYTNPKDIINKIIIPQDVLNNYTI
jgi:hypothetical protein